MVNVMETRISRLPAPSGDLQPAIHVGSNVYVVRSTEGCIHLILQQAEAPTTELTLRRANLLSGVDYDNATGDDLTDCVVLEFDLGVDGYAVAKVAEHLCQGDDVPRTGDDLLRTVESFRSLVETESGGWTYKKMLGLWGELAVLERLLTLSESDYQALQSVQAWKSTGVHCQDFVFGSIESAFDVKTTARIQRHHQISSVDQVAGREGWETSLVSLLVRPVAPEEGHTVMDLISRIRNSLDGHAVILFESKIRALDIDEDICGFHHLRERHGRPVMMFEDVEIPGVEQFLRPRLPAGVPELSWPVVLSEEGMSGSELNAVLQGYLRCSEEVSEDE